MPQDLINKITDPSYYWSFDIDEDWTTGGAIYMVPLDYQYKYIYLAITVIDYYAADSDSDFELTYWPVSHTIDNEATVVSSYNSDINSVRPLWCLWGKNWNYDKNLRLSSFSNSSYLKENCFNGFDENKKTYIKTAVNPSLFILLNGRGNHDGDYFDWIKLEPLDESQYNIVQSTKDWRI